MRGSKVNGNHISGSANRAGGRIGIQIERQSQRSRISRNCRIKVGDALAGLPCPTKIHAPIGRVRYLSRLKLVWTKPRIYAIKRDIPLVNHNVVKGTIVAVPRHVFSIA
jgi:hypothetical protein